MTDEPTQDRPGPVGPTDAARNPPTSVGSVGVPGRGTEPPFTADEMAVLRDCVAAAVADLLMKIDMHGGKSKIPPRARERWDALVALAPKVGLDL